MASVKVGVYDVQKAFQPQAFNVFNHANWYVQYGDGINQMQYNRNRYQLRRRHDAEPDLPSRSQLWPTQFRRVAGNHFQRPAASTAIVYALYVLS